MKKHREMKIARGTLEEQKLREEKSKADLRAWLFILPVTMVAVLLAGVYFSYLGYAKSLEAPTEKAAETYVPAEEEEKNPMLLRVVNSASELDASYVPELRELDGVQIAAEAKEPLEKMMKAAEKAGIRLVLEKGYISFEEEKERYKSAVSDYQKKTKSSTVKAEAYVKRTIPREGESEHQTGLLVWLSAEDDEDFESGAAYSWLTANCVDYGFILRYPEPENPGGMIFSPHLFRYVGEDYAYFIRAYDMTLDQYANYLDAQ